MLPAIKAKAKFPVSNPSLLLLPRGNAFKASLETLLALVASGHWSSQIPRHSQVTVGIKDIVRLSLYQLQMTPYVLSQDVVISCVKPYVSILAVVKNKNDNNLM